jgi:hypothetical protein
MLKELSRQVSRSGRRQSRRRGPARPQVEALEDCQIPTVSFFGGNLF